MAKLKINRGTKYVRSGTYSKDGVLTSLVGATIRFTMKSTEFDADTDDSTAVVIKNVTNGTAQGAFSITLNPSDTATLTPGKYYYDIKVDEDSDGVNVYKIDEGTVELDGSPTNRLA